MAINSINKRKALIEFLSEKRTVSEWDALLDALLTEQERQEIEVRLQIVSLLRSGIPQRIISKNLGVGIATITRGSKVFESSVFEELD